MAGQNGRLQKEEVTVPKKRCKALRKDGKPCQGLGQEQFDGYCIAHAPANKAWEWRSKGGKASSTAARADKRVPEHLRSAIEKVNEGMEDLNEGKIEPASLSAMSRAARVLVDLHRLADNEMELIRAEEDEVAASQVAGGLGSPDLIERAEAIAAWQDRYRIDYLIAQGLVTREPANRRDTDTPPVPVLTASGRQRFHHQRLAAYTRANIDDWRQAATSPPIDIDHLSSALFHLHEIRTSLEERLTDSAPDSPPVLDPLTGQPLTQLPASVQPAAVPCVGPDQSAQAVTELQDLLQYANEAIREAETVFAKQFGKPFDIRDELLEEDE